LPTTAPEQKILEHMVHHEFWSLRLHGIFIKTSQVP